MKQNILVIDDDPLVQAAIATFLTEVGFAVHTAPTLTAARRSITERSYEAAIIDQLLPDGSGIDLIRDLRANSPDMAIVVITGAADIPLAVRAMQEGADNFLSKPVSFDSLLVFLKKSLEVRTLRRISRNRKRLEKPHYFDFGVSSSMSAVQNMAKLAGNSDSPVIIMGETGVGKGVLARWIHEKSSRSTGAFVEVNCSGLRGELLASELFGHSKGAFTSAVQDKQGLLDIADGGTLFLDEIGDMDISVQAQFLKVIEEKTYRRLGEVRTRTSDFRLICATNRNIVEDAEQNGKFRKDLLYRINVMPIVIPPLRERTEDIERLSIHILKGLNYPIDRIPPDILSLFKTYSWPGNVRELRNMLERAVILSRGNALTPKLFDNLHLPGPSRTTLAEPVGGLELIERETIKSALKRARGNVVQAARELGISRATIYRRMKRMQLRG